MNATPAGVWVRVSSGGQDEANQVPDVERYCAEHGYTIITRYELNDKSAYKGEQAAKQQEALADTRAGTVKVVVVWASDRIERRGAEATLAIFRKFREAGGRLESVQEPFLSGKPEDAELMTAITGWKDRAESARKSERVRLAFDRIKANGAVSGAVPYGYAITGEKYERRMVPDPVESPLVREAAARYLKGESLRDICDHFMLRGIRPPKGKRWEAHTLSRILRNPAIIGRKADRDGNTVVRAEALISTRDFERIGKLMASKAHRRGCPSRKDQAMLTSVIRCAECGRPVYAFHYKNGVNDYGCRGPKGQSCRNYIRMDEADNWVTEWVMSDTSYEITEPREIKGHNHDDEIYNVRQDIKDLDPEADDYDERNRELRAELKRLRSLPAVPDRVDRVPTGRMVSDEWPGWSKAERGEFLMINEFTVKLYVKGTRLPRVEVIPGERYSEKVLLKRRHGEPRPEGGHY